jgi:poly-gamma-glutamate synthesis protein (capsule biosynthesis protein)
MVSEVNPVRLTAVGDIFPGDHYFTLGHGLMSRTEQGTLTSLFTDVAHLIHGVDVALCNLEGPLSYKSDQQSPVQSAAFRGAPQFCRLIKQAGFTHVNIANNHILQHGRHALDDTLQVLEEYQLQPVGLDGSAYGQISRPVISRIRERNVCVVGYSGVKERHAPGAGGYAYFENPASVAAEIASLSRQFDEVIVSCHAGEEGLAEPSPAQISMFRQFIDAGARCVLGHHSHVFQPVEQYKHGLIAYSLGNFVFDLFWDANTLKSAILSIAMTAKQVDWNLVSTEFSPDYRVTMMPPRRSAAFGAALRDAAERMASLDEGQYAAALSRYERHNALDKAGYFLRNILRGNTRRKLHFLLLKLRPPTSRSGRY